MNLKLPVDVYLGVGEDGSMMLLVGGHACKLKPDELADVLRGKPLKNGPRPKPAKRGPYKKRQPKAGTKADFIRSKGDAKAADVVEAGRKKGLKFDVGYVYSVRTAAKADKKEAA